MVKLLDRLAATGRPDAYPFPRPMLDRPGLDFSFSGLKTAVSTVLQPYGEPPYSDERVRDVAASFQAAVVEVLVTKCARALHATGAKALNLGGGVACNRRLREELRTMCEFRGVALRIPSPRYCADNAAMIAWVGARRLARGERVRRVLTIASGEVTLERAGETDELALTETTLTTHHGPRWRLVIIGAGQMSLYLAQMARTLDYEVIVCDPRDEYASGFAVDGATLSRQMPDDLLVELKPDGHTAVIALTHDPKLDDLALMEALNSPAFYVGAIGSRANQAKRKARLTEHFGLGDTQLARLHGPVGLKNGARTPPEIAISILAELTAVRYGYRIPDPIALAGGARIEAGCTT